MIMIMSLYTLLYLKWITNNDLMHSMGGKKEYSCMFSSVEV